MAFILIVEDTPNIRLLLSTILRQLGHRVMEAQNGLEALEYLKTHPPDIIMTDINMPGMDGLELITAIRRSRSRIPIVVVSAYNQEVEQALKSGANHHLIKPFARQQLIDVVNQVLH